MFGFLFVILAGVAAWRMAEFEDRTAWPWVLGTVLAALALPEVLGVWGFASPLLAIAAAFAGLWWMRARDERNDRDRPPKSKVVR